MIYIGVDVGKSGGYAIIDDGLVIAHPYDDKEFVEFMHSVKDRAVTACVEQVGAMPGQGVTSMFSFGKSAGFIEGVLQALGIKYQLVQNTHTLSVKTNKRSKHEGHTVQAGLMCR